MTQPQLRSPLTPQRTTRENWALFYKGAGDAWGAFSPGMGAARFAKYVAASLACLAAVTLLLNSQAGEASQDAALREMRSAMRYSMQPVIRLAETAPGEPAHLEFMGQACRDDCSGHLAGWQWAARHDVKQDAQCEGSKSESFAEGCRLYLWRMGYSPEPN